MLICPYIEVDGLYPYIGVVGLYPFLLIPISTQRSYLLFDRV